MGIADDEMLGKEFTDNEVFDIAYTIAEEIQAYYISGNTSKTINGKTLFEFVEDYINKYL